MAFVALRPLPMADGVRHVGQSVPEAASWTNLRAWINQGHVARVEDASVEAFVAALRQPGGVGAAAYAPSSKPHHLAAAARKMQLDAEGGLGADPPPPSEEPSASAAVQPETTSTPAPQPEAKATRPVARKRR